MPDPNPSVSTCAECGARLQPGQSQCDLCGHSTADVVPPGGAVQVSEGGGSGSFCNQCGTKNPPGSRFCSQCGMRLQAPVAASRPLVEAAPTAPIGRTLGVVLGAAVLLVVALFVISALSERATPATPAVSGGATAEAPLPSGRDLFMPLSTEQEETVVRLERDLNAASGQERIRKQHEMVNLLIGFGRPDLAAQAQEDLARLERTPVAWTKTGDLYFQWMTLLEDGQGTPGPVAARALAAYDSSLALQPGDHDVRARLAWAAQYDAQQPMRAIEETQAVLAQDSTHIGSLQNYAIFLARIGRTEQAIAQMERVKRHVGADSVLARSANAFIDALRRGPTAAPGS